MQTDNISSQNLTMLIKASENLAILSHISEILALDTTQTCSTSSLSLLEPLAVPFQRWNQPPPLKFVHLQNIEPLPLHPPRIPLTQRNNHPQTGPSISYLPFKHLILGSAHNAKNIPVAKLAELHCKLVNVFTISVPILSSPQNPLAASGRYYLDQGGARG